VLPQTVVDGIEEVLEQISRLGLADFLAIYATRRASYAIRKPTRPVLRLSAADFSWLDKRVRDVMRPVIVGWGPQGFNLTAVAIDMGVDVACAIVRRDRLTPEQYDAWVDGFRRAGVRVPPHPSEVDERSAG